MVETIVGAVLRVVPGAALWLYRRYWPRLRRLPARITSAVVDRRAQVRQRRDIADAAKAGEVVVVAAVGSNPTRVTWAGAADSTSYHYRDLAAYKRDVQRRVVPHRRAFCCGRAPKVGTRGTV